MLDETYGLDKIMKPDLVNINANLLASDDFFWWKQRRNAGNCEGEAGEVCI